MKSKLSSNIIFLSLITGKKDKIRVPSRSGLNWGQRPNRNENQAYIAVPADIQRSNFFPDVGIPFNVNCDDGFKIIMVRAQQNGKALHSSKNNAILGEYFRKRLDLQSESLIILKHLESYGRFDVKFEKIGDKEFNLDFSN
jgi:hypothetical protein